MSTPGPGDEVTWGPSIGDPMDPRTLEPTDDEEAVCFMREQLEHWGELLKTAGCLETSSEISTALENIMKDMIEEMYGETDGVVLYTLAELTCIPDKLKDMPIHQARLYQAILSMMELIKSYRGVGL